MNFKNTISRKSTYTKMDNSIMNKNIKEECDICGEFINNSTRKKIICPHEVCSRYCCRVCFSRYVTDTGMDATCMWCKKGISLEFIEMNSTKKFVDEYADYKFLIQFERAETQLILLQDRANEIVKDRKIKEIMRTKDENLKEQYFAMDKIKNSLDVMYKKISTHTTNYFKGARYSNIEMWEYHLVRNDRCDMCDKYMTLYTCDGCNFRKCKNCAKLCLLVNNLKCVLCNNQQPEFDNEQISHYFGYTYFNKYFKPKKRKQDVEIYDAWKVETRELIKTKITLNNSVMVMFMDFYKIKYGTDIIPQAGSAEIKIKTEQKNTFVKKCPDNECRGFLSSSWKCGICDEYYCPDCHKKKNGRNDEEHVCDEDEKSTIALLKTETKPCPSCNMPIVRISGCSQVWTPCCKIAFDWNTMKIDAGRIHSPEYYDYIRRTNNGVIPRERGDVPVCGGIIDYYDIPIIIRNNTFTRENYIMIENYRLVEHARALINTLPHIIGQRDNTELGVKYLIGDITKEQWKKTLKMSLKKESRENEIYHILNMFIAVSNDMLQILVADENVDTFNKSYNTLFDYTNEQILKINKRYKSVDKKLMLIRSVA